jgi:hypothetical protein
VAPCSLASNSKLATKQLEDGLLEPSWELCTQQNRLVGFLVFNIGINLCHQTAFIFNIFSGNLAFSNRPSSWQMARRFMSPVI